MHDDSPSNIVSLPFLAAARAASAPALGKFGGLYGGSQAMQDVYRRIEKVAPTSATVLIVGESGSGKTTTGRVVVKLVEPSAGRVEYDGRDVTRLRSRGELRDYRQRVLVVAPAALRDGPWRKFLARFDMRVETRSYEELVADARINPDAEPGHTTLDWDIREYALVVVDEAHNIRNPSTQRAEALRRLLAGTPPKKLVLLTATPVNNSLWDLYALLTYFVKDDAAFLRRAYLDLAYEYQARNVLLVLGEYIWNQEVIPPAEQWRTGVESVRRLADHAADRGVEIALELEPFKLSLVNDIQSMVRFLDDVNHPAVKANIDVSHLQLSQTAPAELRRLKGKACHVHISDCDGKVHGDLPPGRGVVDFLPYLREIKALDIDGTVSIELEYSPQPDKIVDWVREAYQATDMLMREVNLRG